MSVSSPSATPVVGHGKSLAERFGVELKSKTSWADMEDSDEEDSAVPVFTHQVPTNAAKATATTTATVAPTPAPTSAPAAPVVKVAPRGWGKPDAATNTKVTETITLTTPSKSNSSTSANNTSPTSTTAFTSPATSTTAPAIKSAHVPAPSKQPKALPTFKTWGELTSSLAPKTVTPAVAQPKSSELPSGLTDDADDEEEEQKESTRAPAVAFDPELDSSRDGLPLLFKGLTKAPVSDLNVVMEEDIISKSRQGTKRKEMEPETDAETAPVDMHALVAGLKSQAAASASTATATPTKPAWGGAGLKQPVTAVASTANNTEEREVQQPATGKKMKQADGTAKNVEPAETKKKESALKGAPSSFLAAVTGTSMEVESSEAAVASAATSAADLAKRIKQRQKQVDLGKSTPEYQNYLRLVPLADRLPHHPRTPNIKRDIPKRSMDGQLKVWRRALHAWDPEVMKAKEEGRDVATTLTGEADAAPQDEEEDDGEMIDHSEQASEDGFVILQ